MPTCVTCLVPGHQFIAAVTTVVSLLPEGTRVGIKTVGFVIFLAGAQERGPAPVWMGSRCQTLSHSPGAACCILDQVVARSGLQPA